MVALPPPAPPQSEAALRREGFLMALAAVALITPEALFVRLAEAPGTSVLIWRNGAGLATILGWLLLRHGPRGTLESFRGLNRWAFAAGAVGGLTGFCFISAAALASAGTVLTIVATTPLWAALFSRILLGETLPARSLAAIGVGLLGAAVAGLGGVHEALRPQEALGALAALAASVLFGLSLTCMRRSAGSHPLAMMAAGAGLSFLIALTIGDPGLVAPEKLIWPILLGGAMGPCVFALGVLASRRIRSAEISLIYLAETPLGILWVWAILGERPGWASAIGGAVILAAVGVFLTGGREKTPG